MLSVIFNPKNTTLPGDSSAEPQNDICHVERKRNIPWKGKTCGLDITVIIFRKIPPFREIFRLRSI